MPPQQNAVRRTSLEQITIWSLIATLAVAMLVAWPGASVASATTKAFLLGAGAIITLGVYILARLSRGNIVLPPLALVGVLWIPAVAYGLSSAFSSNTFANSFWGTALEVDTFGFILIAAVLGTVTALSLRRTDHYRSFFRMGVVVMGVLALLQALIVIVGQFAPQTINPAFALMGSIDDLAYLMGLLVMGILLTLRFVDLSGRDYKVLLAIGALALFLLSLANMPVVWVVLGLVALGLFVESVMRRGPKNADADLVGIETVNETGTEEDAGMHSLVMPLVVLAISLFFLLGGSLGAALAQSLNVGQISVRPSWQSTYVVGQKVYAESPLFGSGPGTFGNAWAKHRDVSLNTTAFWNTDFNAGIGFIPTSMVTTGLVGVIGWIAFFALFLWFGVRMLILRAPTDPSVRLVSILSFVGLLYLLVMMVFGLPNAVTLALAFVMAGVFASTMRFAAQGQQWGIIFARSPRLGFVIVFSLTILLLSSVVGAYTLAEHYVATSRLAHATASYGAGNLDAAESSARSAISFNGSAIAYQIQAGIAIGRLNQIANTPTTAATAAATRQAFQDALSTGVNAALTSTRLNPNDYRAWMTLGSLYAQAVPLGVSGAYESAKSAYQKAVELNPTNPVIPFTVAQLDIAGKNLKSAEENLKSAVALKQDYTQAIFLLSQLQVQTGNVKDALAAALAAAYFTPNDPNVLFQVGVLYAAQNDYQNAALALNAAVAANAQFANARYFLAAVLAKNGDLAGAASQIQAIAALSEENAKAVAPTLTALQTGKNPFPANLFAVPAPAVNQ